MTNAFLSLEYWKLSYSSSHAYNFSNADNISYASNIIFYVKNGTTNLNVVDLHINEVEHLNDVKILINASFYIFICILCINAVAIIYYYREKSMFLFFCKFIDGLLFTFAYLCIIFFLVITNWKDFFINFHKILFPNGNWMFHKHSILIKLFPEEFWIDCTIAFISLSSILSAFLILISFKFTKI